MKFIELTEEEFRTFSSTHPLKSFMQTPEMAKMREKNGYKPYYVGVKKGNKIVAATMMGSRKSHFGYYEFYAPRGLLIEYEDYELLSFFTQHLKTYIRGKKGYSLRIDPYYITEEKDIDGKTITNGIDHHKGIKNLKRVGFKKSNDIFQQFKYLFALSLNESKQNMFKKIHTLPKRMIKKALKNGIVIREANFEELKIVDALIKETSKREGFVARDLSYYEALYKSFYTRKEEQFMLG